MRVPGAPVPGQSEGLCSLRTSPQEGAPFSLPRTWGLTDKLILRLGHCSLTVLQPPLFPPHAQLPSPCWPGPQHLQPTDPHPRAPSLASRFASTPRPLCTHSFWLWGHCWVPPLAQPPGRPQGRPWAGAPPHLLPQTPFPNRAPPSAQRPSLQRAGCHPSEPKVGLDRRRCLGGCAHHGCERMAVTVTGMSWQCWASSRTAGRAGRGWPGQVDSRVAGQGEVEGVEVSAAPQAPT